MGAVAVADEEDGQREIPVMLNEDASNFRAQGFEVDDNNEPAPENIPRTNDTRTNCEFLSWGSESIEPRRAAGVGDMQPNLVGSDATLHSIVGYFIHFLPMAFIKNVVIPATSANLSEALTWEEFLRFLGLLFLSQPPSLFQDETSGRWIRRVCFRARHFASIHLCRGDVLNPF